MSYEADEISRSGTGYVLLLTARGSSVLKDYYKILIPLVLLGRNDPSEEIAKDFQAVRDGKNHSDSECEFFFSFH